ncbi:MAG: WYL domain-containing protein [Spirochaetales bacterium]|nr:WYL domain-containing protein [Spirochaetales bacterium]
MSKVERIVFIDRTVKSAGRIHLSDIMHEFCVSARQAARDIQYLRYSCGAPLEYDAVAKSYRYSEPFDDLDFLEEDALLCRVLIHKLATSKPFIPLNASEIDRRLEGFVPPRLAPLEAAVRFELSSFEEVNRNLVSSIMQSIADRRRGTIEYRDIYGRESVRTIEPRRLVNYSGAWYCYAIDVEKSSIRNFKLSRILSFLILDAKQASDIDDTELDSLIDRAYGAYKGPTTTTASVRFYGPALSIVEHEVWHPEQRLQQGKDPDNREFLELTIPVYRFEELLGRVLRFGSNARPTSPIEFVEAWKEEIIKMRKLF